MKMRILLALLCAAVLCVNAGKPKKRIGLPFLPTYLKRPHADPKYEGIIRQALVSLSEPVDDVKVLSLYEKDLGFRSVYKLTYRAQNGDRCFLKWTTRLLFPPIYRSAPICKSKDRLRRRNLGPANGKKTPPTKRKRKAPPKGKGKGKPTPKGRGKGKPAPKEKGKGKPANKVRRKGNPTPKGKGKPGPKGRGKGKPTPKGKGKPTPKGKGKPGPKGRGKGKPAPKGKGKPGPKGRGKGKPGPKVKGKGKGPTKGKKDGSKNRKNQGPKKNPKS